MHFTWPDLTFVLQWSFFLSQWKLVCLWHSECSRAAVPTASARACEREDQSEFKHQEVNTEHLSNRWTDSQDSRDPAEVAVGAEMFSDRMIRSEWNHRTENGGHGTAHTPSNLFMCMLLSDTDRQVFSPPLSSRSWTGVSHLTDSPGPAESFPERVEDWDQTGFAPVSSARNLSENQSRGLKPV